MAHVRLTGIGRRGERLAVAALSLARPAPQHPTGCATRCHLQANKREFIVRLQPSRLFLCRARSLARSVVVRCPSMLNSAWSCKRFRQHKPHHNEPNERRKSGERNGSRKRGKGGQKQVEPAY